MKNFLRVIFIAMGLSFLLPDWAIAASDTAQSPLKISAYLETYYVCDFANPTNHDRPSFVYSHNRHNEVNLNIGLLKASYQIASVRANLGIMAGTYANANLASEPGVLKNIYEANVGVKIIKNHNLWIDGGVFASHIGFESALGKDCWTLTRSISADNTPYYLSGAKLTYSTLNNKWLFSVLLLNGWQRIKRVDGNDTPAFGTQIQYRPNAYILLNSSTFIGNDKPDSLRQMRYFHDFYGTLQLSKYFAAIAHFDIGTEQKSKESADYNTWYNPSIILKYTPNSKISLAARGEYYDDKKGVIISTGTVNGFRTWGYSLNVDYNITPNAMLRIEARNLNSKDEIFRLNNKPSRQNYFVSTVLIFSL